MSEWIGQGWGDSRIEVNEDIKSWWLAEIGTDFWLHGSADLFEVLRAD